MDEKLSSDIEVLYIAVRDQYFRLWLEFGPNDPDTIAAKLRYETLFNVVSDSLFSKRHKYNG